MVFYGGFHSEPIGFFGMTLSGALGFLQLPFDLIHQRRFSRGILGKSEGQPSLVVPPVQQPSHVDQPTSKLGGSKAVESAKEEGGENGEVGGQLDVG